LAYLVAGFLIGPAGMNWVASQDSIATIAELGLIFLLFMIGLEIDLKKIAQAGRIISISAGTQIVGGTLLGVGFFWLIGMPAAAPHWDTVYLGVAAALSSTVIIVKVLYDKHELDTLTGRITIGFLVFQDLFAILFLAVQPSLTDLRITVLFSSIGRVGALIAAAFLISRYILPHLFRRMARLPELVLVGAIAWCFASTEFAAFLGLSREMGALIAGVSLSTFPYALDVTAKVTSLRDFFLTLFFVALGMTIPIPTTSVIGLALLLAAFTVVSRLLTTVLPLYAMNLGLRASLVPAINLSQLSEFSLVVLQLGLQSNHISSATANAGSLAFTLLAVLSTFAMIDSDRISRLAIGLLKRIGIRDLDHGHDASETSARTSPILLLGFYRAASSLLAELDREHSTRLDRIGVIDFNPHVHQELNSRGVKVRYGDIGHQETLVHADVAAAKIVISSVPDALLKGTSNEKLVRQVRALNATAKIIATADVVEDVERLYEAGANYVIVPRLGIANDLFDAIKAAEANLLDERRAELAARLAKRREVLP
jgi:Kef-type K+ transport system membrane component KefB